MIAPAIRLAYNPGPINAYRALDPMPPAAPPSIRLACNGQGQGEVNGALKAPTLRLACAQGQAERNGTLEHPSVRLAVTTAMSSTANGTGPDRYPNHVDRRDGGELLEPALLVSFVYLRPFLKNRERYAYRDWVLDSGAFSARNSGTDIKLQDYIDTAKELLATDPKLTEVFALDVIGDWRATLRNTEEMWRQGVPAIPCYHYADNDWQMLKGIARDYPKIAIGGMADLRGDKKIRFAEQCFARVWPKPMHGFGCGSEKLIMALPWHSVDATNWEIGPCKFGRWASFGNMSVRGSKQNLRAEVEWYLRLEQRARARWRREMAKLGNVEQALRLAISDPGRDPQARIHTAIGR